MNNNDFLTLIVIFRVIRVQENQSIFDKYIREDDSEKCFAVDQKFKMNGFS